MSSESPDTSTAPSRILNNIRQAYSTLASDVGRALQTQLGDRTRLTEQVARLSNFQRIAHLHQAIIPIAEWEILGRSIGEMQRQLDAAATRSADPLEGPIPQPLKNVFSGKRGRPKKEIDPTYLREGLFLSGTGRMGHALGCHPRTVRRRALEAGIVEPCTPVRQEETLADGTHIEIWTSTGPLVSTLTHSPIQLDAAVAAIHRNNPRYGQNMTQAALQSQGHHVPRAPLVQALRRVLGPPDPFGHRRIVRRKYSVPYVNSLWHHDGHHAIIRYKIVTHCFVDGKSRMITSIRVSNNNRAQTVLEVFDAGMRQHGIPSRVRGDHGTENVLVAARITDFRGPNRGSYIWGRSVHNIRIERLWRDYYIGMISGWYDFFHSLEAFHELDVDNPAHIWLIHLLFLDVINEEAQEWARTWNNHRLRTEGNHTPRQIFFFGMQENRARGVEWKESGVNSGCYQEFGIDWEFLRDSQNRRMVAELVQDGFQEQQAGMQGVDLLAQADGAPDSGRMNEVVCEPPTSSISEADEHQLREDLLARFTGLQAKEMNWEQRSVLWGAALEMCRERFRPQQS